VNVCTVGFRRLGYSFSLYWQWQSFWLFDGLATVKTFFLSEKTIKLMKLWGYNFNSFFVHCSRNCVFAVVNSDALHFLKHCSLIACIKAKGGYFEHIL